AVRPGHLRLEHGADDRAAAPAGSPGRQQAEAPAVHHGDGREQDRERRRRQAGRRQQLHHQAVQRRHAEEEDRERPGIALMKNVLTLSDEDYLLIEDAVGANARGRAFLRMRYQRSRVLAADDVKRAMRSLAGNLKKAAAPEKEASSHIRILRQELQEVSVYIQQTRSEIAALRPDDSGNNR